MLLIASYFSLVNDFCTFPRCRLLCTAIAITLQADVQTAQAFLGWRRNIDRMDTLTSEKSLSYSLLLTEKKRRVFAFPWYVASEFLLLLLWCSVLFVGCLRTGDLLLVDFPVPEASLGKVVWSALVGGMCKYISCRLEDQCLLSQKGRSKSHLPAGS